ncbi:MAG: beta-propeller domain-containing protein [Nocardioides sp.]
MQIRRLAVVGVGVTAGALAGLLAAGPLAPRTEPVPAAAGPAGSSARAAGPSAALPTASKAAVARHAAARTSALPAFTDCASLRRWYVDAALPDVGPWGFGGPWGRGGPLFATADVRGPVAVAGRADATKAVGSSATGTNVQEQGVDEPDVAKTDGRMLVRVVRHHLVVVDVSGNRPRKLSWTRLPGPRVDSEELLLLGDTALVVGQRSLAYWGPLIDRRTGPWTGADAVTHLTRIDLSAPGAPRVLEHQRLDGSPVAVRSYPDGTVRLVLRTGYPALDFVMPNRHRTRHEATRLNRRIVRQAPIDAWLPSVGRGDGSGRQRLVACSDVRHPRNPSGFGTITVLTLPGGDPGAATSTAVTAAGDLVYSSLDRLYVATLRSGWWEPAGPGRSRPPLPRTAVDAFALDGSGTAYLASGSVPGSLRDRWSLDEHEGRLRVATALGRSWRPRENAVSVLAEDGDRLRVVGSVRGLGRGENIESVRWFDDLAVVVTFRQTDPLYTVDLAHGVPRLLGALKVPGFSAYLHPVGGDLVLGAGMDATTSGSGLGGQLASFDLRDRRRVTRVDTHGFGRETEVVVRDPRSFTYLPDQRLALVPVEEGNTGTTVVHSVRVGRDGTLHPAQSWELARWWGANTRSLPLGDGRVALVGRAVHIVHAG